MDADTRYAMLYSMADEAFDVRRSEEVFVQLFEERAVSVGGVLISH